MVYILLPKVIDWCEHHRGDPVSQQEEINDRKRLTEIDEWDQKFMEVDQETLFEIILVCNQCYSFVIACWKANLTVFLLLGRQLP
jgi:hypothetical protein